MNITLQQLEPLLKKFVTAYLVVITIGLSLGLYFVNHTTEMTPSGAVERFNGSNVDHDDEFAIPENYPKPLSELLITTHNHVMGFSFIFGSLGFIFYFNSRLKGFWKSFFMIEPFVSIILSFGSIWLMRFIHPGFVYITVISAIMLYISFYTMVIISISDLWTKKKDEPEK